MKSKSLRRILVILVCGVLAPVFDQAHAGPAAHWTFDEGSGTIAHDSVGSFHGTLSSAGSSFVAGGISGNALSLNRALNGYVDMGNIFGFTSQAFSLSAWVKTAPGYSISDSAILSRHTGFSKNGYWLMVNQAGGGGQTSKAIFGQGAATAAVTSTTSVTDGNWHHIVATYLPGSTIGIYVDGSPLEGTALADASLISNTARFLIGGVTLGAPEGRLTGLIDDVQVYNQVLSASDVDFLFQNPGQVVPEPGSVALVLLGTVAMALKRKKS